MRFNIKNCFHRFCILLRRILIILGILLLMLVIYAFTSGPFWQYYHLGTKNSDFIFAPDYIVLLGGSGMPSESNLIRAYYAAKIGKEYPALPMIIALPGDTTEPSSAVIQLADELIHRGIETDRIMFEPDGINTRSQAMSILKMVMDTSVNIKIVIVTSPEHMRRSLLCFRKAGFRYVGGYPAFEYAIESDITAKKDDFGGRRFVPDVSNSISLRYRLWVHLKYEIIVFREYIALAYYKLKGWI